MDAILDLLDHHRLVNIYAAVVELDLAEEGHDVETRQGIAHLARIQRSRILDRLLEGEAGRGRLGDVVVGRRAAPKFWLYALAFAVTDRKKEGLVLTCCRPRGPSLPELGFGP